MAKGQAGKLQILFLKSLGGLDKGFEARFIECEVKALTATF